MLVDESLCATPHHRLLLDVIPAIKGPPSNMHPECAVHVLHKSITTELSSVTAIHSHIIATPLLVVVNDWSDIFQSPEGLKL